MLCYSWNVNGIRALGRKDLLPWKVLPRGHVIALQETKASPEQLPSEIRQPKGWKSFWHSAKRRGYSGTAIFTREEPDEVITGLDNKKFDDEGRVIAVRFGELLIISAYFPNSQEAGARLHYKLSFCKALERYLKQWRKNGNRTLLLGDYNIAHHSIDLARPKENETSPGYLPEERQWMTHYLKKEYHDIFRERNPDLSGAYTWWSFRSGARKRNVGWRLDYGTVSSNLLDSVRETQIHPDVVGSDHCPVSIKLK